MSRARAVSDEGEKQLPPALRASAAAAAAAPAAAATPFTRNPSGRTFTDVEELNRLIFEFLDLGWKSAQPGVLAQVDRQTRVQVTSLKVEKAIDLYTRSLLYASKQTDKGTFLSHELTEQETHIFPPTNVSDHGFFVDRARVEVRRGAWMRFLSRKHPKVKFMAAEQLFHRAAIGMKVWKQKNLIPADDFTRVPVNPKKGGPGFEHCTMFETFLQMFLYKGNHEKYNESKTILSLCAIAAYGSRVVLDVLNWVTLFETNSANRSTNAALVERHGELHRYFNFCSMDYEDPRFHPVGSLYNWAYMRDISGYALLLYNVSWPWPEDTFQSILSTMDNMDPPKEELVSFRDQLISVLSSK